MAEVTIHNDLLDASDGFNPSPNVVFISSTTGYAFYVNSSATPAYKKTTDGGATWGSEVTVSAITDGWSIAVWYDRWTPGDTTGTKIHLAYADGSLDGTYYRSIDTGSADAQSSEVDATGDLGIWSSGSPGPSICKATDGDLFLTGAGTSGHDVFRAASGGTTFASTSATFLDASLDYVQLVPLASGAVMVIQHDISVDDIVTRVYSAAGSWDGSDTTVDNSVADSSSYEQSFSAMVYKATNDVYLIYNNYQDNTTCDIETAVYSGGSWTNKAEVLTNTNECMGVSLIVDDSTGYIYALYCRGGTAGSTSDVYYKKSTDGMTTWGNETKISTTQDDIRYVNRNAMNVDSSPLYVVWFNDDLDDLLGDSIVAAVPADAFISNKMMMGIGS